MSKVAIEVVGISKKYRLRRLKVKPLKEDGIISNIIYTLSSPFNFLKSTLSAPSEEDILMALNDISFKVDHGEIVGLIGPNGAGKSTLLKILSRITRPTSGYANLHGRVGALIEVGTGFHPELTGRENVYLNGTILGLRRREIEKRFDRIVDFSGVENYIDTAVKYYSSGMRVRLGFAVAAHLEPEILIIDEVLAVGDLAFQRKSLGKIEEVANDGRAVLIVSHNMSTIQSICKRGILLANGKLKYDGKIDEAIGIYIDSMQEKTNVTNLGNRKDRRGGEKFRFERVKFLDAESKEELDSIKSGQDILIRIGFENLTSNVFEDVDFDISIYTANGTFIFHCSSKLEGIRYKINPKEGSVYCKIPNIPLNNGDYKFNILARWRGEVIDYVTDAGFFFVSGGDFYNFGSTSISNRAGVLVKFGWE